MNPSQSSDLQSIIDQNTSHSDEFIIQKVIGGEINLFEIIIKRYNQQLFRIIRSYVIVDTDAKDALQSTYTKAFEKLKQFRSEARFSTWLIRIAINEALKKLQDQQNISDLDSVTYLENRDQKDGIEYSTPETKAIQNDMNKHLEQAIDALPQKHRSVLIMHDLEQMTTEETATLLNISDANVKVRLHRARKMLRVEIENMIGTMDLFEFKGKECEALTDTVMRKIRAKAGDI